MDRSSSGQPAATQNGAARGEGGALSSAVSSSPSRPLPSSSHRSLVLPAEAGGSAAPLRYFHQSPNPSQPSQPSFGAAFGSGGGGGGLSRPPPPPARVRELGAALAGAGVARNHHHHHHHQQNQQQNQQQRQQSADSFDDDEDDEDDDSSDDDDDEEGEALNRPAPSGAGSTPSRSSPRLPFTFDPQHVAFSSSSSSASLSALAGLTAGQGNPNAATASATAALAGNGALPVASPTTASKGSLSAPPTALEVIPFSLPYLSVKDAANLKLVSKACGTAAASHSPEHLGIVKTTLHGPGHATLKVFESYGKGLLSLSLHRTPFADKLALTSILSLTPQLRKLSLQDCGDWNYDDAAVGECVAKLLHLQEIRLQCGEQVSAERNPFAGIIKRCFGQTTTLQALRKVTLFSRLDADSVAALIAFLNDHVSRRRLTKLKLSTSLLGSPGATPAIFHAITANEALQKVTIVRPENSSEPLKKAQCALLGAAIYHNHSIRALHLRRCGIWCDCLGALVPPGPAPNLLRLKLDGNSLGYCSGGLFNESMDLLLSRFPNLTALHLGNNSLDASQAQGLATSIQRHRMSSLENLTLGSNDIGDNGTIAILKALPSGLKQLYLHGVDCTDASLPTLKECLDHWPNLWGLGLNGNPITDAGARILAKALKNRPSLRDCGITLSDVTDAGIARLASSLATCANLRYVYLYTTGFKSSQRVTQEAKEALKKALPPYACAAFDHRLSRYLKKP